MLKRRITPKKSKKYQRKYFRHVTGGIHRKIVAIVVIRFVGKCNGRVNIAFASNEYKNRGMFKINPSKHDIFWKRCLNNNSKIGRD